MDTLEQINRHVHSEEDGVKVDATSSSLLPSSIQEDDERRIRIAQTQKTGNYNVRGALRDTLFKYRITGLLIFAVPAGFAVKYTNQSPVVTFAVNFVAIIPLGQLLDAVTEELVIRRGGHEAMLIVITFSNAVQLVIAIIALVKHETRIVQTSLIGGVISNSVLMVGVGFFFGGINVFEQNFNADTVGSSSNELVLSVAALIIPTAMKIFSKLGSNDDIMTKLSRGEAVLLLLSYICFCFYCYKTHASGFNQPHIRARVRRAKAHHGDALKGIAQIGANLAASAGGATGRNVVLRRAQEISLPKMSQRALTSALVVITVFLGFNSTFAVDSIDGLTQRTVLTQNFIGLILLPLLGCNPRAIILAAKDEMPTSFAISISSSIQLLLGILPLAVIIGWVRHEESMTLVFDTFQVVSLAVSILILKYMTDDGKSNWLDGVVLITLYAMIAVTAWLTPDQVLRSP